MKSIFEKNISGDLKCRTCMLMVTHTCNLKCIYCYETHKDNQMMSFEMAKMSILKEVEIIKNDERFERLEIDFMGGEPLMNFPLIRQVVEWLEVEPLPIPFICFATTNGTLLDEETKVWFRQHHDTIWLGASCDGSIDSQRKNRGEQAQYVDYSFFYEVWPRQSFKMTVSKESLPHLAEGILELQRKGYQLAASLAQGVAWENSDTILYLAQLRKLSAAYENEPNLIPINLLTRQLFNKSTKKEHQKSFCGTGRYMVTYDIDGKRYGCHMFSPVVLGEEKSLEIEQVDWETETIAEDVRCNECCMKDYCPTCMGFNYHYRGSVEKRDFRWCKMILAEAIASCEFQVHWLSQQKMLKKTDAKYAQCAIDSYSILSKVSFEDAVAPFTW